MWITQSEYREAIGDINQVTYTLMDGSFHRYVEQ